jgi:hypothetical protein
VGFVTDFGHKSILCRRLKSGVTCDRQQVCCDRHAVLQLLSAPGPVCTAHALLLLLLLTLSAPSAGSTDPALAALVYICNTSITTYDVTAGRAEPSSHSLPDSKLPTVSVWVCVSV